MTRLLLAAVGLLYGWIGLATSGIDRVVGLTGAVAIVAAAALAARRWLAALLVVAGAVPLAVITWWSIVTPALAVIALGLTGPVLGRPRGPRRDLGLPGRR
jgi:hypothetical protein